MFYEWYCEQVRRWGLDISHPSKRPSVVAHSFGSFIVGKALLKYPDIHFDKVILCGSILPEDFPWEDVLGRGQVGTMWNDFGSKDFWVWVVPYVASETGRAGRYGFSVENPLHISNGQAHKGHPDYFKELHWESQWLPFLVSPPRGAIIKHGGMCRKTAEMRKCLGETDAIDTKVYGSLPHYGAARVSVAEELAWAQQEPEIYTFLLDKAGVATRTVGYVNAAPVTDEYFAAIKAGAGGARDMLPSDIVPFERRTNSKLYIVSIAVDPGRQAKALRGGDEAAYRLICACMEKLRRFQHFRKIGVEELVATVWTHQGRQLCRKLGMSNTGVKDQLGHEVWWGNLDPASLPRNSSFHQYFKRNRKVVQANRGWFASFLT